MQKYLHRMVEVAEEDKAIEAGVLDFYLEALKNVPTMIWIVCRNFPGRPLTRW